VFLGVEFRGVAVMLRGMQGMAVRYFGVMRGLLVMSGPVMFGRLAVVLRGMLVMLGGMLVMFVDFVTVHGSLPAFR
jgi:hypothetical protein